MKIKLTIGLLFFTFNLFAGYSVKFIVSGPLENREVYIAGNFNNGQPGEDKYKLLPLNASQKQIIITDLKPGLFEYKFTKGDWAYVETNNLGLDIPARTFILNRDTVINIIIAGWHDEYVSLDNRADSTLFTICWNKGEYYVNRNLDSSYKYAMLAYPLAKKLDSKKKIAMASDLMGEVHIRLGYPKEAANYFFDELELMKQIRDSIGVANTYINLGYLFGGTGDEEKGMEYFRESLKWGLLKPFDAQQPQYAYKGTALIALGRYYFRRNQLDSAEYYAKKSAEVIGDHDSGPITLMGDIYKKQGKIRQAITQYLMVAVGGHNDDNNLGSMAGASNMLAKFYLEENQLDSAFWFSRRSFALSSAIKDPYNIANNGLFLVFLFERQKQFDSAFFYQQKVMEAKDQISNKERERQLQTAYYNEKMKQQDAKTQTEKYRLQKRFYILLAGLIILLLLALQYRSKLKTDFYKKTAEMEMKALRAQMNPHFIFNCLTSINRYIVKSDHKTASNYLTKFAKLIRLILDNSAEEYISLDTEEQTLRLYIDMELLRFDHAFEYEISNDEAVETESISIPPMLIQPYVENAIWHGLLHKQDQGKLYVRFERNGNNSLIVKVEDNGVGRQKAKELEGNHDFKKKSYGMQISKDRIEIINRLYKYKTSVNVIDLKDQNDDPSGTRIVLEIPLTKNNFLNA